MEEQAEQYKCLSDLVENISVIANV